MPGRSTSTCSGLLRRDSQEMQASSASLRHALEILVKCCDHDEAQTWFAEHYKTFRAFQPRCVTVMPCCQALHSCSFSPQPF